MLPEDVYDIAEMLRCEAHAAMYPHAGYQALIASHVPRATAEQTTADTVADVVQRRATRLDHALAALTDDHSDGDG